MPVSPKALRLSAFAMALLVPLSAQATGEGNGSDVPPGILPSVTAPKLGPTQAPIQPARPPSSIPAAQAAPMQMSTPSVKGAGAPAPIQARGIPPTAVMTLDQILEQASTQTFIFAVMAEQARQRANLCQSGFGDPSNCVRTSGPGVAATRASNVEIGPAPASAASSVEADRSRSNGCIWEIAPRSGAYIATLHLPNGVLKLSSRERTTLPAGQAVKAVTLDGVFLQDGSSLPFCSDDAAPAAMVTPPVAVPTMPAAFPVAPLTAQPNGTASASPQTSHRQELAVPVHPFGSAE